MAKPVTVRRDPDGSLNITGPADMTGEEANQAMSAYMVATVAAGKCWRCDELLTACSLKQITAPADLSGLAASLGVLYAPGPEVFTQACYRCGYAYSADEFQFTEARMADPTTRRPLLGPS